MTLLTYFKFHEVSQHTSTQKNVSHYVRDYCHQTLLESVMGDEARLPDSGSLRFKLLQVHVLMRHGDRSPIGFTVQPEVSYECGMTDRDEKWLGLKDFTLKRNPETGDFKHWETELFRGFKSRKCLAFQLTLRGFRQLFAVGKFMKKRYSPLITEKPTRLNTYVQCTDYRRTIHSAASFALAFLPNGSSVRAHIPIHLTPGSMLAQPPPGVTASYHMCNNLVKIKAKELQRSKEMKKDKESRLLFNTIADLMGLSGKGLTPADIFDDVWGRLCHGLPLPCNGKSCMSASLAAEGAKTVQRSFSRRFPVKSSVLALQPFLFHSVIKQIDSAISSHSSEWYKFLFSFAHDSTLTSFLVSVGISVDTWLPYASRIVVEVWQESSPDDDSSYYYIRILLNGKSMMNHLSGHYQKDDFSLNGELLDYRSWRNHMTTGPYRTLNEYNSLCSSTITK